MGSRLARLVAALVHRVTCSALIVETSTEFYGLRTSKTSNRRKRATQPHGSGGKVNQSPPANPAKVVVFGGVRPASRTSSPVQASGAQ